MEHKKSPDNDENIVVDCRRFSIVGSVKRKMTGMDRKRWRRLVAAAMDQDDFRKTTQYANDDLSTGDIEILAKS